MRRAVGASNKQVKRRLLPKLRPTGAKAMHSLPNHALVRVLGAQQMAAIQVVGRIWWVMRGS